MISIQSPQRNSTRWLPSPRHAAAFNLSSLHFTCTRACLETGSALLDALILKSTNHQERTRCRDAQVGCGISTCDPGPFNLPREGTSHTPLCFLELNSKFEIRIGCPRDLRHEILRVLPAYSRRRSVPGCTNSGAKNPVLEIEGNRPQVGRLLQLGFRLRPHVRLLI